MDCKTPEERALWMGYIRRLIDLNGPKRTVAVLISAMGDDPAPLLDASDAERAIATAELAHVERKIAAVQELTGAAA